MESCLELPSRGQPAQHASPRRRCMSGRQLHACTSTAFGWVAEVGSVTKGAGGNGRLRIRVRQRVVESRNTCGKLLARAVPRRWRAGGWQPGRSRAATAGGHQPATRLLPAPGWKPLPWHQQSFEQRNDGLHRLPQKGMQSCSVNREGEGREQTLLPEPVEAVVVGGSTVQVAAVEKACVTSWCGDHALLGAHSCVCPLHACRLC